MKNKTRQTKEYKRFVINEERTFYTRKKNYQESLKEEHKRTPYASPIINKFRVLQSTQLKLKNYKEILTLDVPYNFSLFNNPVEACKKIYDFMTKACKYKRIEHIIVNYDKMNDYDLLAEAILGALVLELKEEQHSLGSISVSGKYPSAPQAIKFIKAIGIINTLAIDHEKLSIEEEGTCKIFNKNSKKTKANSSEISRTYIDDVSMDFIEYIDDCLNQVNLKLTEDAGRELVRCISEVLCNIKEHSGEETWKFLAFLDTQSAECLTCEIVILNFGKTIPQTFNEYKESYNINQMNSYVNRHQHSYLTGTLQTVFALQQNVSSKNIDENSSRGQGTIQLIEFFQNLHDHLQQEYDGSEEYKMLILTEKSLIHFTSCCSLREEDGRKTIAFNESNSLSNPPNRQFITELSDFTLPGTLIGMKFAIPRVMTKPIQE